MSSHQLASVVEATPMPTKNETVHRSSINYPPSIWGQHFISFTPDDEIMHIWCEEAKILKEKVRRMLTIDFVSKPLEEKLKLIDTVQRLGISYHFNKELEEALKQVHDCYENSIDGVEEENLQTTCLLFRLLREHGYNISSDIFNKYKDSKGGFKESLSTNIEGLLNLYEATHMRVHEESTLDEAFVFVSTNLQLIYSNLDPCIAEQVLCTLNTPIRGCLPRIQACKYIHLYQENKSHNDILLTLTKLDFNILQKKHQQELSLLSKWWKSLEFDKKLPFARDRLTECYFWALGVYYEPQFATTRKFFTKVVSITSIIDDIYDNYGTNSELKMFTDAVEKWEIGFMNKLPDYMKICYQALLNIYDEIEEELAKEGRSYALHHAKEAMKIQTRIYYEELKWLNSEKMPTFDEYLEVALVSTGFHLLATIAFAGMGEIAAKEVFDWLLSEPKILKASSFICRIMDDMVAHEFERQRDHIPSAVQCYMNQYGVSEQQTCVYFNKKIVDAWKDINQSFFESQEIPTTFLMVIMNFARLVDLLYKDEDCYSKANAIMKQHITCVLVTPMDITLQPKE